MESKTPASETSRNSFSTITVSKIPNLLTAKRIWDTTFDSVSEIFALKNPFGLKSNYLHMLGKAENEFVFLPYNDQQGINQGRVSKHVPRGSVLISIKHYAPRPSQDMVEHLKFQGQHIQLLIGVDGGVMTINNPRDYMKGLFGPDNYPFTVVKPFVPGLTPGQQKCCDDNTRTWAVLLNTTTTFPGSYNGNDPMTCTSKEKLSEFANHVVDAFLGVEESMAWLEAPENKVYCAELAFLSLSFGTYFPLNKAFLGNRYQALKSKLGSKDFLASHENPQIKHVDLCLAPEEMRPLDQLIPIQEGGHYWAGLPLRPYTSADVIEDYLKRIIPRSELGEDIASKLQAKALEAMRPSLHKVLKWDSWTDELRDEFETLFQRLLSTVSRSHIDYSAFREALAPDLERIGVFSRTHGLSYVPPHAFLLQAHDYLRGLGPKGILGWEYVGHGLHSSLFDHS